MAAHVCGGGRGGECVCVRACVCVCMSVSTVCVVWRSSSRVGGRLEIDVTALMHDVHIALNMYFLVHTRQV